ncbi:acetyl-CoA carboxylase biotin carboxylase subunit family protein [Streptomyces sp. NPDC059994]|uniref:ATP-grasp domain-containing protein n=1 Tax=Streptomyces sp. NPDC059994 TaxID=3347029 RepID=UPI00368C589B
MPSTVQPPDAPVLVLLGSGERQQHGYAWESLAARHRVFLLDTVEPTWQRPFITGYQAVRVRDGAAVRAAVREVAARHRIAGVLTWDEHAATAAASAARETGCVGADPAAVRACRNKSLARAAMEAQGIATRWAQCFDLVQARAAAAWIGYPLVLKPAASCGRDGVVKIATPEQLPHAYAFTARAAARQSPEGAGMLVEEYLDGPEISIETISCRGHHTAVARTHTQLGELPGAPVTAHMVAPDLGAPATDEAARMAATALTALGITHGASHVELRLTATGPRVIEVSPCLAGDLIPHLVRLATGVDLVAAAADLARGRTPDLRPTRAHAAAIGFLNAPAPGGLQPMTISAQIAARPWCERAVAEHLTAAPLPVATAAADGAARLAHVVVTATTPAQCRTRLEHALAALHPATTTDSTRASAAGAP